MKVIIFVLLNCNSADVSFDVLGVADQLRAYLVKFLLASFIGLGILNNSCIVVYSSIKGKFNHNDKYYSSHTFFSWPSWSAENMIPWVWVFSISSTFLRFN